MKQKIIFFSLLFLITFSQILTGCIETEKETNNGTTNFEFSKKYEVKVINIIDGDTIDVQFQNNSIERIRFLGIDTPETKNDNNYQNEYGNISDINCLANWGLKAKNYTTGHLIQQTINIEFDENAGFKGGYGRLLSYIYLNNGTDFNEMILKNGFARVYTFEDFSKKEHYLEIQNNAINKNKGLWNCN